jgi:hypothetical protein
MFWASTSIVAAGGGWHLGIGDPTTIAWCIVVAYAVAVGLAVWAFLTARRGQRLLIGIDPQESCNQRVLARLWLVIAIVMLALGVNKQLDLQTWLLQTVRRKAYEGGWYDNRRTYQVEFIGAALVLATLTAGLLAYLLRRVLRRVLIAVSGLVTLTVFVVIRAASFHYVDKFLQLGGRIRINVILELSGIALIIVSVLVWRRSERAQINASCAAARRPGRGRGRENPASSRQEPAPTPN